MWTERLATQLPQGAWRTRFAPAPTGYLHLGHVVNAVFVWGVARAFGGQVVLRLEDHDRTRCRPEFERALCDDLEWLGFDADVAPVESYRQQSGGHPNRQSDNYERYAAALRTLEAQEQVYACACSRRAIAAGAPTTDGEVRYPGTCRDANVDGGQTLARRVRLNDESESFDDLRLGLNSQTPALQCGDILARDRNGNWTYQFAVTVDDMAQDIDVIIRGEDLLASTGRQQQVARLLGRASLPRVLHHPLLVHSDGTKLSKANHDTAIRERRARGESAASLIGEAAFRAGLTTAPRAIHARDVSTLFAT